MKWPENLTLIRHGESAYNALRKKKAEHPLYIAFRKAFDDGNHDQAFTLAQHLINDESLFLSAGDHDTALTEHGQWQAQTVAGNLRFRIPLPHVVFVSPYDRTHHTYDNMVIGWPELGEIPIVEEERIREQEHGLYLLYNDRRIFQTIHPEQRKLMDKEGPYWYRYPQGENVPDIRERNRSWIGTLTRDYREKRVLAIAHHLTILSTRANVERLSWRQFIALDKTDKPINCGVTIYNGNPHKGSNGRLELAVYNAKLY